MTSETAQTIAITAVITGIIGFLGNSVNSALKKINDIEELKAKLDAFIAQYNRDLARLEKDNADLREQIFKLSTDK